MLMFWLRQIVLDATACCKCDWVCGGWSHFEHIFNDYAHALGVMSENFG
jgi:hypothetical protein